MSLHKALCTSPNLQQIRQGTIGKRFVCHVYSSTIVPLWPKTCLGLLVRHRMFQAYAAHPEKWSVARFLSAWICMGGLALDLPEYRTAKFLGSVAWLIRSWTVAVTLSVLGQLLPDHLQGSVRLRRLVHHLPILHLVLLLPRFCVFGPPCVLQLGQPHRRDGP